ncbi:Ig-like domain-containing protein [Candidatus Daviesbacteria bacterium]|nr:Ig-like domain-containing protein [Candidatus Daviesbacteria bacterium]
MSLSNTKNKIITAVLALGLILIAIFKLGLYSKPQPTSRVIAPQVIATNPSPLDDSTILPTQSITITFNLPVQNIGELKYKISPLADIKPQLSEDRKTVTITPNKPYSLGGGYTLFITGDTKFDGKQMLGPDYVVHFKTISYRGV